MKSCLCTYVMEHAPQNIFIINSLFSQMKSCLCTYVMENAPQNILIINSLFSQNFRESIFRKTVRPEEPEIK